MRRKPVSRSEIRFDGFYGRVRTLPVDAVRPGEDAGFGDKYIVPIPKLWAALLQELTEWRKRDVACWQAAFGFRQNPPDPVRLSESYHPMLLRLRACQRCGREFYNLSLNGRYCSDDCAKASWRDGRAGSVAAMVKARSEERAAARADRRCANPDCNKPITAERSTGKFCSVRCRVAAHRQRKAAER